MTWLITFLKWSHSLNLLLYLTDDLADSCLIEGSSYLPLNSFDKLAELNLGILMMTKRTEIGQTILIPIMNSKTKTNFTDPSLSIRQFHIKSESIAAAGTNFISKDNAVEYLTQIGLLLMRVTLYDMAFRDGEHLSWRADSFHVVRCRIDGLDLLG